MLSENNAWFLGHKEPLRNCLLFLRNHILERDPQIKEKWSYGMPFYFYKGKRFCYLWIQKRSNQPYIGFVDGDKLNDPALLSEKRARMKIFLIEADKDVPVKKINSLLKTALQIYA